VGSACLVFKMRVEIQTPPIHEGFHFHVTVTLFEQRRPRPNASCNEGGVSVLVAQCEAQFETDKASD
jgi:hypothetical protein